MINEEKEDDKVKNPMKQTLNFLKNLYLQNKEEIDRVAKEYKVIEKESIAENDLGVDCISRDEVCRYVAEFVNHEFSTREEEELIDNIITGIEHMSSVTPQEPRWIPVSEKLPEDFETVIASVDRGYVYPEARYSKEKGWEWAYESGAEIWTKIKSDVLAWMSLPKPYKAESENKG